MYSVLMPRPAVSLKPTPRWQTTFNSALIATNKGISEYGYRRTPTPVVGSIGDGTIDILSGALINYLGRATALFLRVNGALPNSGWEYLFIADQILRRQDASFTPGSAGGHTEWSWFGGPAFEVQSNIFLGMA